MLQFVQQLPGQKLIFWLDNPADSQFEDRLNHTKPVGSITRVSNLVSSVCNPARVCWKVERFVKIVVDPGAALNRQESRAGYGSIAANF